MDENTVTIKYKNYKRKGKGKLMTISGVEFIRRFLMHVLPKGFVKIRHYGILGNRNKKTKLRLCKKLTNSTKYKSEYKNLSTAEILKKITGKDITQCPTCLTGKMLLKLGWNKAELITFK